MTDQQLPGTVVDLKGTEIPSEAQDAVVSMLTPADLINYQPLMPAEVEELIMVLSDRIAAAPGVLVRLYEEVHRAEEVYEKEFSKHMVNSPRPEVTMARAYAKHHTNEELHTLNLAKEKMRYAEWLQSALTSKLYGYLNINKAMSAQMFGQGRG